MNRSLFAVCLGLIVAALVAGFSMVGGPGYARMQEADRISAQLLDDMRERLVCKGNVKPLPESWDDVYYCVNRQDTYLVLRQSRETPELAKSFRENLIYERISDNAFRVCHMFEVGKEGQALGRWGIEIKWNGKKGCLSGRNGFVP